MSSVLSSCCLTYINLQVSVLSFICKFTTETNVLLTILAVNGRFFLFKFLLKLILQYRKYILLLTGLLLFYYPATAFLCFPQFSLINRPHTFDCVACSLIAYTHPPCCSTLTNQIPHIKLDTQCQQSVFKDCLGWISYFHCPLMQELKYLQVSLCLFFLFTYL